MAHPDRQEDGGGSSESFVIRTRATPAGTPPAPTGAALSGRKSNGAGTSNNGVIVARVDEDYATLEAEIPEDVIHIHATGAVDDFEVYFKFIANELKVLSVERGALDIELFGDCAVMTGLRLVASRGKMAGDICIEPEASAGAYRRMRRLSKTSDPAK